MRHRSPSPFAYALRRIGQPSPCQRRLLLEHYHAPGRALTAAGLAERVGYTGHGGVNLFYGLLAAKLEPFIGAKPAKTKRSLLIALVRPRGVTGGHRTMVMRPEFAEGLKQAGWV